MMTEIKRYDLFDRGFDDYTMKEFPNGQYVRFEDHAAAMQSVRSALDEMLCSDCPRIGHSTDETRCTPCPRRVTATASPTGEAE